MRPCRQLEFSHLSVPNTQKTVIGRELVSSAFMPGIVAQSSAHSDADRDSTVCIVFMTALLSEVKSLKIELLRLGYSIAIGSSDAAPVLMTAESRKQKRGRSRSQIEPFVTPRLRTQKDSAEKDGDRIGDPKMADEEWADVEWVRIAAALKSSILPDLSASVGKTIDEKRGAFEAKLDNKLEVQNRAVESDLRE